mmetsp:Transcript_6315/g.9581  ORF Transcript_6315/g.9581 Transcript_6315/m.9581 type:complete len:483 (-) Transcript_6315:73-1521(-)|eukprot:CAMPEP_0201520836 /NCGR_PEP_ID=MMETSP0161_2-20130828/12852_1 /ASSEMBLY_ACC=CAM_ASM_000251 /TAXON_ID=180227 /ORGANISM="Neoparamoeba aestuarina, Strain SoJaBio B1-5/56/2" /LENGTH=482 /DNA_ID=CAMNT_0047919341 /DNA_START=39 /DNA_END=1490 /DNA_ORIENTATION=-
MANNPDSKKVIPNHMPGEPPYYETTWGEALKGTVLTFIKGVITLLIGSIFWIPSLIGILIYGYPPHTLTPTLALRMFIYALTSYPKNPPVLLQVRIYLIVELFQAVAGLPLAIFAWHLDEFLYGNQMNDAKVVNPLFEISAGRSGSTQLGHYLTEDPDLLFPPQVCVVMPYIWVWKLIEKTVGTYLTDRFSKKWVNDTIIEGIAPEFVERHEFDVWKPDTFEIAFLENTHRFNIIPLGPEVMFDIFRYNPRLETEKEKKEKEARNWFVKKYYQDDDYWENEFVDYFERILKKTLVYYGNGENDKRRLFVKGHFICAAKKIAENHPDATFLCMARRPHQSMQSGMNFIHSSYRPIIGRLNWDYIVNGFFAGIGNYCERELEVFGQEERGKEGEKAGYGGAKWCVVRFDDYVVDLEVIMKHIYKVCWDGKEIPASIPLKHAPRKRHGYSFNRSLEDVGIDVEKFKKNLERYYEFCEPVLTAKKD